MIFFVVAKFTQIAPLFNWVNVNFNLVNIYKCLLEKDIYVYLFTANFI